MSRVQGTECGFIRQVGKLIKPVISTMDNPRSCVTIYQSG